MNGTRFSLLPVGAHFDYEGRRYVKSTPLLAAAEDGGRRMIPRSATVDVVALTGAPAPKSPPESIAVAPLQAALARYHAEALACVSEAAAGRAGAAERLERARTLLGEELGIA